MSGRPEFRHDPGIFIEAVARPGLSGVIRLVVHRGLSIRPAGAHTLLVRAPAAATFWCAFYTSPILRNRWEPYDQPNPAAYMPFPYIEFDKIPLGETGAFLVQREAHHESVQGNAVDDGSARSCEFLGPPQKERLALRLNELITDLGVPRAYIPSCVESVLQRCSEVHASESL